MALKEIWIETGEDYSKSKKKFSYGYNEDIDTVVISKDGTLGKVIVIDGLRIGLPKIPNHPSKIINGQVKDPKNQKWKRVELPDELDGIPSYEIYNTYPTNFTTKWDKYIDKEFDRRENGVWIMINGEAEFMPAQCYMFVQWNSLGGNRYPKYRYAQRVLWTHWAACVADDRCLGQCYLKNRRSGYSTMNSSDDLDHATSHEFHNVGIMSKSGKDAKKMFVGMIVPAFQQYPFFFKPLVEGSNSPKSSYVFKEPAQKISKANKTIKAGGGLNSEIEWWNTGLNSMDGMHIEKMSLDEIGKFPKDVPFNEYWPIALECLTEGGDITGKCMAGSTANASDKGGDEFKDIYNASKIHTRDEDTEQTESGLYSLFIPAEYNLSKFMDEFGHPILYDPPSPILNEKGKPVKKGAISHLRAKREQLKSKPAAQNEEYRKHPSTESHAFRDPSINSIFNISKIYQQSDHNANVRNIKAVRGDFQWKNNVRDSEVIWIPSPYGKMLMRWMPAKKDRNKRATLNGKKTPANKEFIVGGIDSYDIGAVVSGRGSDGSMHIYVKHGFDEEVNNEFVLEYTNRAATAEIFFENCLLIAFFYGAEVLIESNKPRILYHWKERGYTKYSARRWDKAKLGVFERQYGGIPNSSDATKLWHAQSIGTYIENYIGINDSDDPDLMGHMGSCHFPLLLQDWEKFDINNRTKFDRTISSGLCLMLANKQGRAVKTDTDTDEDYQYVRTY